MKKQQHKIKLVSNLKLSWWKTDAGPQVWLTDSLMSGGWKCQIITDKANRLCKVTKTVDDDNSLSDWNGFTRGHWDTTAHLGHTDIGSCFPRCGRRRGRRGWERRSPPAGHTWDQWSPLCSYSRSPEVRDPERSRSRYCGRDWRHTGPLSAHTLPPGSLRGRREKRPGNYSSTTYCSVSLTLGIVAAQFSTSNKDNENWLYHQILYQTNCELISCVCYSLLESASGRRQQMSHCFVALQYLWHRVDVFLSCFSLNNTPSVFVCQPVRYMFLCGWLVEPTDFFFCYFHLL